MSHDERSRDLIGDYLEQLRRGLRIAPGQAEEILAEAEDHLRETAAAGIAVGMTEREAHEAAISSFGPVNAVTRAHLARANGGMAALAMAGWKLDGRARRCPRIDLEGLDPDERTRRDLAASLALTPPARPPACRSVPRGGRLGTPVR